MIFDALLLLAIIVASLLTADAFFRIPIDWTDGIDGLRQASDRASRLPAEQHHCGGEAAGGQGGGSDRLMMGGRACGSSPVSHSRPRPRVTWSRAPPCLRL